MLLDMAKLIKANRTLLNSNIFPHEEMSMRVLLAKERILKLIQVWDEEQIKPWSLPELLFQLSNDSQTIAEILKQREEKRIEREQAANLAVQKEQEEQAAQSFTPYWNFPMIDDDDDEHTIQYRLYLERSSKAITPDLSTEEPDNSLSMGDEHLDTIPETESDEVIKSSVEDLVPIPSESEGIFNMCDVPSCDKKHFDAESDLRESLLNRDTSIVYSPKIDSLLEEFAGELAPIAPIPLGINKAGFDQEEDIRRVEQLLNNFPPLDVLNDHFEIFSDSNYDCTSSDDDYGEDIDFVEASPPDSEIVSLEEVKDFDPEDGETNTDILLKIKDDILREKLLNINLLIAKIEALNDNPTPDCVLKSPSPFPIPIEDSDSFFEKSDTSLSYSDNSLPEFDTFSYHTEETSSGSTTTHADNSLPEYDSFLFEIEPD
ncbi:hypothetical protein Tco_0804800 [Tanacetum coccineum]|uniref:Uncharacterized protein n=1 Tax=Tanacetum coccineum TaxID=301880 RepID=A0ABQ5A6A7_9ASTR